MEKLNETWESQMFNLMKEKTPNPKENFKIKEYKGPRTFTEMFGSDGIGLLKENRTYEEIYREHLTEEENVNVKCCSCGKTIYNIPASMKDREFECNRCADKNLPKKVKENEDCCDDCKPEDKLEESTKCSKCGAAQSKKNENYSCWGDGICPKCARAKVKENEESCDSESEKLEESMNTMEDFKAFINSDEMSEFIEITGADIESSSRQFENGTIEFMFPRGYIAQISKAGYVRLFNESGDGTRILNRNGKVTYLEGLDMLEKFFLRNKSKYRDTNATYHRGAGFMNWQDKIVNTRNDRADRARRRYGLE